jgi:toxin-antitoxin system PIN domain toxin
VILPDVNVLLYALRRDAKRHDDYRTWLQDVINGDDAYGVATEALASVIRISTHPAIFDPPSALAEAMGFCRAVVGSEYCALVRPGPQHWRIFSELCERSRAKGNLVQDAWFAALAIESGCEWVTTDRDYARFAGLRWREPF